MHPDAVLSHASKGKWAALATDCRRDSDAGRCGGFDALKVSSLGLVLEVLFLLTLLAVAGAHLQW